MHKPETESQNSRNEAACLLAYRSGKRQFEFHAVIATKSTPMESKKPQPHLLFGIKASLPKQGIYKQAMIPCPRKMLIRFYIPGEATESKKPLPPMTWCQLPTGLALAIVAPRTGASDHHFKSWLSQGPILETIKLHVGEKGPRQ